MVDREIIHVDIAAFAVAVEQVVHPELRGRPVVVAPVGPSRTFVLALSWEARQAGLRKGMVLAKAIRYCRDLVVLPPNEPLYERASSAVCRVLQRFSPVLEPAGYGHAYLDLTGTGRLLGPPRDAAWRAQKDLRRELRLEASVGVASNKMVSRIASAVMKPAGLQEVALGGEASFLAPLPVTLLPGVGSKVHEQMEELNIRIVHDIAVMEMTYLALAFGRLGFLLHRRALGIDNTPVYPMRKTPMVQLEGSLAEDTNDYGVLRDSVFALCEDGGEQLRAERQRAGSLELHIRYSDYRDGGGRTKLAIPTQSTAVLRAAGERLLKKCLTRRTRVRRIWLRLGNLSWGAVQLDLFADHTEQRQARLESAVDRLRRRFGPAVLVKPQLSNSVQFASHARPPAPVHPPFVNRQSSIVN